MINSFLSREDAAQRNRNNILHFIKKYGPISRTDIWKNMNISRASVTQVTHQLQEDNLIIETGEGTSTGGRKPSYITFNGAAKKLIAFDGFSHTLCLMDLGGTILYEKALSFSSGVSPVMFAATLKREISQIIDNMNVKLDDFIGLGLSLPGLIDSRSGVVTYSVELGWQGVSISELFFDMFGENVFIERTGNVMAMGAYASGLGRDIDHFQLFILGTDGIGVSTIIHGDSQHGANYMHGELGHIKIPDSSVICSCGQRGCLEAVINSLIVQSDGVLTDQILEYMAFGISTVINISDPSSIVLVGSYVSDMSPEQREFLSSSIREKVASWKMRKINIRFIQDTRSLALNGICSYVFDRIFSVD